MAQGRDTISQRISIEGALDVIQQLKQMGAAGEAALKQIQNAAEASTSTTGGIGRITDSLRHHFESFRQSLAPVREGMHRVSEAAREFRDKLSETAEKVIPHFREVATLATAGAVAGFVELIKTTADHTNEIKKRSDELGVNIQQYQVLQYSLRAVGVEQERFISTFTRLARSVGEAVTQTRERILDLGKTVAGNLPILSTQVLRGAAQTATDWSKRLVSGVGESFNQLRPVAERFHNELIKNLSPDITGQRNAGAPSTLQFMMMLQAEISKTTPEAAKLRTELFKLGAVTPAQSIGELIDRIRAPTRELDVLFRRLGVQFQNLKGEALPLSEVFDHTATALNKLSEGEKQFNAQLIFNRGFKEILPLFSRGGEEIHKLREEFEKMNIAMTDTEVEAGSKLFGAFAALNITLENLKSKIILAFSPELIALVSAFTEMIQRNAAAIIGWARGIADELRPGLEEIIKLIKGELSEADVKTEWVKTLITGARDVRGIVIALIGAFKAFITIMDGVAASINYVFGTNFTGKQIAAIAIVGQLIGVFGLLGAAIRAVWVVAQFAWGNPFLALIGAAVIALVALYNNWDAVKKFAIAAATEISKEWDDAIVFWKSVFKSWGDFFSDILGSLKKQVLDFLSLFTRAEGAGAKKPDGASTPFLMQASGGPVPGQGSGDHVPALLEPGEYVVRKSSVQRLGMDFMHAMNRGIVPGFSMGGIVRALSGVMPMSPRLAMAGGGGTRSAATTTLNLTIDGQTFRGLSAPENTAKQMAQFARTSNIVRAGKRPSWDNG